MPLANALAMAMGFVVAAIGVLGVAAPAVLLELGRSLQSPGALYILAGIRVGFGAVLVWAAPNSRARRTLSILGGLIIVGGLVTPFVGLERSRGIFDWWEAQGSFFMRAWPIAAVGFGLFVAYATSPRGSV